MRLRSFAPLLALAAVSVASAANAVPITFILQGTASGFFGQDAFTDASFSFVVIGDTVNNVVISAGVLGTNVAGTVTVSGFPTAAITESLLVFNNQNFAVAGLERGTTAAPDSDLVDISSAAFGTWNLDTSIGPFVETPPAVNQTANLATTGGDLTFTSLPTASFEAIVGGRGNAAPEPGSALLCIAGVAMLAIARRRR